MSEERDNDRVEDAKRILDDAVRPATFSVGGGVHHVIDWDGGVGTCPFCREIWYCCRCHD